MVHDNVMLSTSMEMLASITKIGQEMGKMGMMAMRVRFGVVWIGLVFSRGIEGRRKGGGVCRSFGRRRCSMGLVMDRLCLYFVNMPMYTPYFVSTS